MSDQGIAKSSTYTEQHNTERRRQTPMVWAGFELRLQRPSNQDVRLRPCGHWDRQHDLGVGTVSVDCCHYPLTTKQQQLAAAVAMNFITSNHRNITESCRKVWMMSLRMYHFVSSRPKVILIMMCELCSLHSNISRRAPRRHIPERLIDLLINWINDM
jgi:hypothetical protein